MKQKPEEIIIESLIERANDILKITYKDIIKLPFQIIYHSIKNLICRVLISLYVFGIVLVCDSCFDVHLAKHIKIFILKRKLVNLIIESERFRKHWCGTPYINCLSEIAIIKYKIRKLEREVKIIL